jgi:ABC-type lipoprotein export system ATPase subunit/ABC-type antimicrobial peptide transport system permease subunit
MLSMLSVKEISKTYKEKTASPVVALRGVSFSLPSKSLVFIVGKSGSGKTTLLNLIGGIDSPTSGEIIFGNKVITDFSSKEMNHYRNKNIGFIFQEYNLLPEYSVGKNVSLSLELQGIKPTKETVDTYVEKLGLVDQSGNTLYYRSIKDLSGGQKQRVAIARALIKNPNIILADEPTGALDSETSEELYKTLKEISSDKLVIVVSHDIQSAQKYGDRIIEIADGKVKSDSAPLQVSADEEPSSDNVITKSKKYRLSNSIAAKLSLSGILSKPFRYLLSLITAIFACSLFCFSSIASTTDLLTSELKTCYCNNVKTVILKEDSNISVYTKYENGAEITSSSPLIGGFTESQLDILFSQKDISVFKVAEAHFFSDNFGADFFAKEISEEVMHNPYNYLAVHGINYLVEIDENTTPQNLLLTPDERVDDVSRLPQNYTEIAITDYWADMFLRFGYKDLEGNTQQIHDVRELIGKQIDKDLTICGIYQTEEDTSFLKQYDKDQIYISDQFLTSYLGGQHVMNYAFVYDGFFEKAVDFKVPIRALYQLKGNLNADKQILKKLSFIEKKIFENPRSTDYCTYHYSATFTTRYSYFEIAYNFFTEPITIRVFVIAGIILCVLATLILFNFLASTFNEKKREFGILRALGISGRDLTKIFLFESLFLSLINFICSFIVCEIACHIINANRYFCLFNLGPIPCLLLFGVVVSIALLGSIIPMINLVKKKPIDIIKSN